MFRALFLIVLCLLLAVWPTASHARDDGLQPSSKWVLNYAPDSCTLIRSFGEGDNKVIAQFIRHGLGPGFEFDVMGKLPLNWMSATSVAIRFGSTGDFVDTPVKIATSRPGMEKSAVMLAFGRLDNRKSSSAAGEAPEDEIADSQNTQSHEAAVSEVTIKAHKDTLQLHLGSMGAPMAALAKCTGDLVRSWGLKPELIGNLIALPVPSNSPSGWITQDDVPNPLATSAHSSLIGFRLMVDATGTPTQCFIQSSVGDKGFIETTCSLLLRRARFKPARTVSGQSVPWYYNGRVHWVLW